MITVKVLNVTTYNVEHRI